MLRVEGHMGVDQARDQVQARQIDDLGPLRNLDVRPHVEDQAVVHEDGHDRRRGQSGSIGGRLHRVDGGANQGDGLDQKDVHGVRLGGLGAGWTRGDAAHHATFPRGPLGGC